MLTSNILFLSGSDPTGSIQFINNNDVLAIDSTKNNSLETKLYRAGSAPLSLLFVTSSNNNPRIGVGTRDPQSTFDFREISDTTKGSELILAGSRTAKGAIVGDSAGILNFAIPTGSINIIDSGSVGKIKGVVTNETAAGVEGKLTLELFKNVYQSDDVVEFGYSLGNVSGLFNAVYSSSIELKDYTSVGYSRLSMYDHSNNRTFEVLRGSITASGGISAGGSLNVEGDIISQGNIIAQQYIVSSSVTYMTQSFSSGSTIFGDTLDDTHQFTGSVDITGSFTVDGITFPIADGDNGDMLVTDGAGNLSFTRTTVYANVKNVSGVDLAKGYPVHVTGTSGNASEVIASSASNSATMPAHFILNEAITNGSEGQAIAIGFINGVNTSGFNEGDTIYVAPNGGYTNSKPSGSNLIQNLGIVTKIDASNGSGYVLGAGRSNDVPNLLDNHIFFGSGSNQSQQIHISGALDTTTVNNITADGTIRARVKSFDIPHPTRKGKRLVYGALEGPEHGIYCRGEAKELKVKLPSEWRAMIDKKGITVQITPIGGWQPLYFKKLENNWLYFGCGDDRENVHFYWEIKGERTDVPKLETVQ